ncbi:hypothetical protein E2974_07410 [Paracoccus yeei]|uniref:hypothetical protein n=1 Tax=Paracoccus yeei TaxID=147645 RepID=UPI003BF92813
MTAEKLEIGSRNLTLTSLQFQHNTPAVNWVRWGDGNTDNNAGQIRWVNDAGDTVTSQIRGGQAQFNAANGAVMYLYWRKGDNAVTLRNTYDLQTAFDRNNVILATYQGGKLLDADYGRTTIDGTSVTTGTLDARAVDTDSFYNAGLSVFGGTLESENFNLAAGTGWRITKAGVMNMPHAIVDTLQLKDGAVSTMWSANAASLTISASYPMRLLVLTNIRVAGVNNTYSATGYIRRNGVDVESSSYSVGVYSWMLTMFKTVDIAAGNHTFNHAYTGTAADYSQPRIAIFGTYK